MNTAAIAAISAALVAPILTYIVAARKLSGRIATSEAKDLWEESAAIRAEYREQITTLQSRCERLETQLDAVIGDSGALKAQMKQQERTILELRERCAALEKENAALHDEIIRLEGLLAKRQ